MDTRLTSMTISFMRLPLAVGIVFQHSYYIGGSTDSTALLRGLFSWTLGGMGVPVFFVISGYLFFLQFPIDGEFLRWDWHTYFLKIRRRTGSLLLPYFLWNVVTIFYLQLTFDWHQLWDCIVFNSGRHNVFGLEVAPDFAPVNGVLWFVRDLMVLSLFTPLIYIALRYTKFYFLILLFILRTLHFPTVVNGQFFTAVCFFSLGAYLSIFRKDLSQVALAHWRKWMWIFVVAALFWPFVNGLLSTIFAPFVQLFLLLYFFYSASVLMSRTNRQISSFWTQSAMVVYATHAGVGVLDLATGCLSGVDVPFMQYFFSPLLAVLITLGCFYPIWRFIPGVANAFTGSMKCD